MGLRPFLPNLIDNLGALEYPCLGQDRRENRDQHGGPAPFPLSVRWWVQWGTKEQKPGLKKS